MSVLAPPGRLPLRRAPVAGAAAAGLTVAALMAEPVLGDYGLQIGFRLIVYVVLAEAWNLLAGYTGIVSLGSAAFVGVGGYAMIGLMNGFGAPLPVALALCGLCAALLAAAVAPAVFRMRGLYFTIGTLALAEALRMLVVNLPNFGGAAGLFLDGDPLPAAGLYFAACGLLVATTGVMSLATGTRLSILLRAVRDDEDAAAQFGVRPFRVKLSAFVAASFLMGMAGGLQGYKLGAVEPYGMFSLNWTVDVLSMVIIGGLGQRFGPIAGALLVVALGEALADAPELHIAITGAILILVIRFAPRGICGLVGDRLGARGAVARPTAGGVP